MCVELLGSVGVKYGPLSPPDDGDEELVVLVVLVDDELDFVVEPASPSVSARGLPPIGIMPTGSGASALEAIVVL